VSVLTDPIVRQLLLAAWQESNPGTDSAHEEGGFILRQPDGSLTVERWPRGLQDEILIPAHPVGKRGGAIVVATFHTHPNPNLNFLQAPGRTDIINIVNDVDLNHPEYEGEFVLATEWTYKIAKSGVVSIVGKTTELLRSE
jgi:hypothetical protein